MTRLATIWRDALIHCVFLLTALAVLTFVTHLVRERDERLQAARAAEQEQRAAAETAPRSGDGRIAYVVTPATPGQADGWQFPIDLAAVFVVFVLGEAAWRTYKLRRDTQPQA